MHISRWRQIFMASITLLLTGAAIYVAHTASYLTWVDWPQTFQSIADLAQVAGLAVAGWWTYSLFIKQRHNRERVNIEHHVNSAVVSSDERVVRVLLEMQNAGSVLFQPHSASVRLDVVAPAELAHLDAIRNTRRTARHNWPELHTVKLDLAADGFYLEPLEKERYSVDFLVPLSVTAVQVFSRVVAPAGDYWDLATLHALSVAETEHRPSTSVVAQQPTAPKLPVRPDESATWPKA